jgi:hypothetical protein
MMISGQTYYPYMSLTDLSSTGSPMWGIVQIEKYNNLVFCRNSQ